MKPWGPFDFVKPVQSSHLITPFLFLPLWVLLLFLNMPNVLLSSFTLFYSLQCLFFSSQGLFSVARQEICKNIWSFFSPPFLITIVLDESSFKDGPLFPTQAVSPPCSALPHCGTGRGAHWLTGAPLEGGSTATSPPGPTHWSATAAQPRPYIFWSGILKGRGYLVDKKLSMC